MIGIVRKMVAVVATVAFVAGGMGFAEQARADTALETVRGGIKAYMHTLKDDVATAALPEALPEITSLLQTGASPAEMGRALSLIESVLDWKAVDESWKTTRPDWVTRTQGATSFADVAQSLLALEAATKWEAVGADWKAKRDDWTSSLRAVQ